MNNVKISKATALNRASHSMRKCRLWFGLPAGIGLMLTMAFTAQVEGAESHFTPECNVIAPLSVSLNQSCNLASDNWQDVVEKGQDPAVTAVRVAAPGKVNRRILILSPKPSAAYDISTRTLIEEFSYRQPGTEFTLLNYRGQQQVAMAALDLASDLKFDMIYSMGSGATALVSRYYGTGSVPVVSVCSKDPVFMGQIDPGIGMSGNNIAYTSLDIAVETQVSFLKQRFIRELDKIAVLYDKKNISSIKTQVLPLKQYLESNQNPGSSIDLTLIEVDFNALDRTLREPMKAFSAHGGTDQNRVFLVTGSTELFNAIELINQYAWPVPVLSVTPSHVVEGEFSAFMAIGVSFATNARLAADYGFQILQQGVDTATMPVGVVTSPDISINFSRNPTIDLKVPFSFFEDALNIYDWAGEGVRLHGKNLKSQ